MNNGRMNIQLTPRATRALTASQIAQQLRGPLGRYPGFRAFVNVPAALQIGGFQGNSNYNLMVESLNTDELTTWAPRLEQAVAELPEVQEVSTNLESKSPRVDLVIDRDKAAAVGLNATHDRQRAQRRPGSEMVDDDLRPAQRNTRSCSSSIRSIRNRRTR